jgi:DNA-binding GntR family transcriptional regulator
VECARRSVVAVAALGHETGQLSAGCKADVALVDTRNQRIGRLTTGIPGRLAKSVPEHQQIYEAIVQRDGAAAEALMRRHILSVMADQLTEVTDTP